MTDAGAALLVAFVAFALIFPVLSWDADHRCRDPKCIHKKKEK